LSIEVTLEERGSIYGDYETLATTAQQLKDVVRMGANYDSLSMPMKESVDMICHKIARIVNGGHPQELDHWHDIAGYAKLIEDICY
jgi:hypothetical protein